MWSSSFGSIAEWFVPNAIRLYSSGLDDNKLLSDKSQQSCQRLSLLGVRRVTHRELSRDGIDGSKSSG